MKIPKPNQKALNALKKSELNKEKEENTQEALNEKAKEQIDKSKKEEEEDTQEVNLELPENIEEPEIITDPNGQKIIKLETKEQKILWGIIQRLDHLITLKELELMKSGVLKKSE